VSFTITEQPVKIPPDGLSANLVIPQRAIGVILFAHGSGSSRNSPRNRYVAGVLQQGGFATLLLDLLTAAEEQMDEDTGYLRFNIDLLSERLLEATDWLQRERAARGLSIGYFGASTGAAAALAAAAERTSLVHAVVSRGGRPDLAGSVLPRVQAPTLLIVGSNDHEVIELNRRALAEMRCEKRLAIVAGATHLFEERGTLEEVSTLASNWFAEHLNSEEPDLDGDPAITAERKSHGC
jgi:putative phosphoribosyl transferase